MQIHSLELIDDYSLIGIHSSIEDYRLAFLINAYLHTKLSRSKYNLDFKNTDASFPIFEYENEEKQLTSYLISNKYIGNTTVNSEGNLFSKNILFSNTTYLIKEKRNVDYFIKIEGEISTIELYKTIEKLNKINQVATSYQINPLKLKSKDFLIF